MVGIRGAVAPGAPAGCTASHWGQSLFPAASACDILHDQLTGYNLNDYIIGLAAQLLQRMPPRKKGKGPARGVSSPAAADSDAMVIDTPQSQRAEESPRPKPDILKDPWTDEQETSLFKGIIRWKPAGRYARVKLTVNSANCPLGMHKHFRMIALSENLRNHGYDPTTETHTRIPGIWEKLRTLYNLDIIDERENSFDYEDGDDKFLEFKLPEDYEETMHMRGMRSGSEAPSSPPRLHRSPSPQAMKKRKRGDTLTQRRRASTVEDTDEPRTSPAISPAPRRAGRSANRLVGRVKAESRSRQPSKDTTMDEAEAEEETEEGGDEEEAEEEEERSPSPEASKPASRKKAEPPPKAQGAPRKSKRKR